MKVVPIGVRDLRCVSDNLRKLADDLDSGQYAQIGTAVVLLGSDSGEVFVYGYGDHATALECSGWLSRASLKIDALQNSSRCAPREPSS